MFVIIVILFSVVLLLVYTLFYLYNFLNSAIQIIVHIINANGTPITNHPSVMFHCGKKNKSPGMSMNLQNWWQCSTRLSLVLCVR